MATWIVQCQVSLANHNKLIFMWFFFSFLRFCKALAIIPPVMKSYFTNILLLYLLSFPLHSMFQFRIIAWSFWRCFKQHLKSGTRNNTIERMMIRSSSDQILPLCRRWQLWHSFRCGPVAVVAWYWLRCIPVSESLKCEKPYALCFFGIISMRWGGH